MLDAALFEPDAPFRNLDVAEHGSRWKLVELALRGLVGIRRERRDIDQPGNAGIGPGVRNERAAIGVPDENRRTAHPSQTSLHGGDVARERVKAVLGRHYFVALGLQRRDQFAET